jgi:hypothetical protein
VISVLLYGRNDAHGYNLHRRAALSLNCLAEALTDQDDEIIFVDYNTPDELPTFVEAISDTLTDRCLDLLRVLRVPAALHRERFATRTHLSAIEPVSRNAAVRRANPSNRWLLSTNTDMVILPLVETSLSEACAELPDGFYGLPRFELPEWLWERLPRSDPRVALAEIERLGPRLRLDEPTVSHEWIRFDAPGDFQLILRDDFVAVDGFNEEMLLGYHVDSNLSRRMLLRRGSIESLGERVAGYHCNHNRVPTVYHGARLVSNDLDRFFYSVNRAELPEQRATWGLADAVLEEVPIRAGIALHLGDRVTSVVLDESHARVPSDAVASEFGLTYDSGHVLSFVADSLVVSSLDVTVGYIGANPVLQQLLVVLASEVGIKDTLLVADLDDLGSVEELDLVADVVVIDLGVDASLMDASPTNPADCESVDFPSSLDRVFAALERFIQLERARVGRGEHPRRIVLVNSATAFWDAYVLAHFDCSHTSVHSRVRRATVKAVPDDYKAAKTAYEFARRLIHWSARRHAGAGAGRLHMPADARVTIAELDNYPGFGDGWAYPDGAGIWTQGRRSELAIAFDEGQNDAVLALAFGGVCVEADGSIGVEVLVDGERVAVRDFGEDHGRLVLPLSRRLGSLVVKAAKAVLPDAVTDRLRPHYLRLTASAALHTRLSRLNEIVWRIELPCDVVARRAAQLTFVIDKPRTPLAVGWSNDERELGIHLRSLTLEQVARSIPRENRVSASMQS